MSRIGKIPVIVPKEVKITIQSQSVSLDGSKGKLKLNIPIGIKVEQKDGSLIVNCQSNSKQSAANYGTVRALLNHMIVGVTQGHKKELDIQGVGFRAQVQGNKLTMNLGFSHPIEYAIPDGIKVATPKPTSIIIEGADKALVGLVAAQLRDFKRPEPYKGKGIRYVDEVVRRKQGKSVTK